MRISLSAAWDETKAMLARDGRLFAALALAMLVLPGILLDVSMPQSAPGQMPPAGPWIAIGTAAIAISLAGQLALIHLALGTGKTVGEAITHGFKRLLPYLGAIMVWTLPLLLIAATLYAAMGVGTDNPRGGPAVAFLLIACLFLFLAIRLLLSSAVASAETIGPIAILKRSWALGSGNWWRMFAFAMLFAITLLVVLAAIQAVFGSVVAAATGGLKPWSLGALLVALVSQLTSAAASVIFFVMLARIYRQLAGAAGSAKKARKSGT